MKPNSGDFNGLANLDAPSGRRGRSLQSHKQTALGLVAASLFLYLLSGYGLLNSNSRGSSHHIHSPDVLARCSALNVKPGPTEDFYRRTDSDRFVSGTKPTLIVNATIWTGNEDGTEVLTGDVLLDRGLIKWVGVDSSLSTLLRRLKGIEVDVIDARGAWLTPGCVLNLLPYKQVLTIYSVSLTSTRM